MIKTRSCLILTILIISLLTIATKLIVISFEFVPSVTSLEEEYKHESFGLRYDEEESSVTGTKFTINYVDTLLIDMIQVGISITYLIYLKVVIKSQKNCLTFKRQLTRF